MSEIVNQFMTTFAEPSQFHMPEFRWNESDVKNASPAELLLYRSNLLGSDITVTNFGGGNTSAKLEATDPLSGETVNVLWVKGSGGDIGSMEMNGFATLYQDKLLQLENLYRGIEFEDEMVGYLPHCTFNLNPRAASIDTPLHAYLPYKHIDHLHPDAVTALAASKNGQSITEELYQGTIGWIPWQRPGFDLGLRLRRYVQDHSNLRGLILAGHGLISWGNSSKDCYKNSIELIRIAAEFLNERLSHEKVFGGQQVTPKTHDIRTRTATQLMPKLRAFMSSERPKVGHFTDDRETLEFACSYDFLRLVHIGTSCPDHFLRTKIAPLALDPTRIDNDSYLEESVRDYAKQYKEYYERCAKNGDPPIRDANPVIIIVPGIGRFSFAADKITARLASEFYGNAINVMRGASAIGEYIGLDEKDAFGIEYWALEEAKLKRMPKPKSLAGRVALITGAAGGIGAATARLMLENGACVLLTDFNAQALNEIHEKFADIYGSDFVRSQRCDVTNESEVSAAFDKCLIDFGGIDFLVASAGLASSSPIESTTIEAWKLNYDVLTTGYFLASKFAFSQMKRRGGSIVFIGSKNALAATPNASAYASAKAAAVHLARCLALEGAPHGIRVNVVNPDAVIQGSRIWASEWRKERALAYGVDPGEALEKLYRDRSLLKRDVTPEDVASAVMFFISDSSSKSTGNILNVDAGNAQAFTR